MHKVLALSVLAAFPLVSQVRITQGQNQIAVEIDGKPYTTFFYGPEVAKPYLFPLRTPSGVVVTRSFPMEKVAGESTDHPHHRSLWFAHSSVNGIDYWNNEFAYDKDSKYKGKLGHIFVTKVEKAEGGAKTGEIDETSEWKQPDGKAVLNEDRKMIFHAGGPDRVIDFDFTLTAKVPVREAADIPLGRLFAAHGKVPARIVVYRRPVETRANDRRELVGLVNDVVVEQVAAMLEVDPHELDPGYESRRALSLRTSFRRRGGATGSGRVSPAARAPAPGAR